MGLWVTLSGCHPHATSNCWNGSFTRKAPNVFTCRKKGWAQMVSQAPLALKFLGAQSHRERSVQEAADKERWKGGTPVGPVPTTLYTIPHFQQEFIHFINCFHTVSEMCA